MLEVDPRRVLSALGVEAPDHMTPVVGGWETLLWRVDAADGRRFALRVFRPDQVMTCQREVAVMRALAEQPVPVPSVAAFGSSDNRPAILMSWCAGQPILKTLAAKPWRVWTLGTALGRIHARIHNVPVDANLMELLPAIEIGNRPRSSNESSPASRAATLPRATSMRSAPGTLILSLWR